MTRKLARRMHSLRALWICVLLSGCQAASTDPARTRRFEVWRVDPGSGAKPPVWFSFPKPFESYAGEFPRIEGELRVGEDGTTGWFRVSILEVTLGEEELDKNVRNNLEMLAGKLHPRSTFTVHSMTASKPSQDDPVDVLLHGELELKGTRVRVKAPAVWTTDKGKPARLRGGFSIESLRERFSIVGPGLEGEVSGDRVEVMFDVGLVRDADPGNTKAGDRT